MILAIKRNGVRRIKLDGFFMCQKTKILIKKWQQVILRDDIKVKEGQEVCERTITGPDGNCFGKVTEKVAEKSDDKWNNEWDELLIAAISQRPPIYNYRLPFKDRTDLKIADLWKKIFNCLGGPCSVNFNVIYERVYEPSVSAMSKKAERKSQLFEMMTLLDDVSEPIRFGHRRGKLSRWEICKLLFIFLEIHVFVEKNNY